MAALSRSHGFPGYRPPSRHEILNVLADTAELHAIVEQLLVRYARSNESQANASVSLDVVLRSSQLMLWNVPDVDGLWDTIRRRSQGGG